MEQRIAAIRDGLVARAPEPVRAEFRETLNQALNTSVAARADEAQGVGQSGVERSDASGTEIVAAFAAARGRLGLTGSVTLGEMLGLAGPGTVSAPQLPGSSAVWSPAGEPLAGVRLQRPVDLPMGSGYGMRTHPVTGEHRMHHGVDVGAPTGHPIRAAAGGTVTFAGERGGYGNLVIIDHGNGVTTRYAHASRLDVAAGETVAPGQVIAGIGSTGLSTGPHLHFEVRHHGESVDPARHLP